MQYARISITVGEGPLQISDTVVHRRVSSAIKAATRRGAMPKGRYLIRTVVRSGRVMFEVSLDQEVVFNSYFFSDPSGLTKQIRNLTAPDAW